MSEQTATIGHNSLLAFYREQNLQLPEYLMREHETLLTRCAELESDYLQRPNIVDTDDIERSQTDLGGKIAKLLKDAAASKKVAKEPVAAGTKIVDDFFTRLTAPLETAMRQVERSINAYKDEKRAAAERARQEAERVAREKAAEARRLQEEAQRKAEEEVRLRAEAAPAEEQEAAYQDLKAADQEARTASVAAREAEAATTVKVAPQTTVKAESGAASIQRLSWTGEIEDLEALDIGPLKPFLTRAALDSAARLYALQHKDTRPLAGVRCFQKSSTSFRS